MLLRAYRSIDSFDGRHARAWLLTIMRNTQINRTRRRRPELLDDPDGGIERSDDEDERLRSPEAIVVGATFDAVVVDALDTLPDRFRQVVELVDIDGAEVAQILQSYLDGHVDDLTARRVRRHLEHCRRCGLEADAYEAIKDALARRGHGVDPQSLERLRAFGQRLADEGDEDEAGSPA